jgi:hypothetical protein
MRLSAGLGVLGLLGFVAVHACSADDSSGGDGTKGGSGGSGGDGGDSGAGAPAGGSSGAATGGRGGSGVTGGATGKGGASGAAGQAGEPAGGTGAEAGAGGDGGEGAAGPGASCTECINGGGDASARAVLLRDCRDSPPCAAWLSCASGCIDSACLDACEGSSPGVAPYRYAIYDALCDACANECGVLDFCDRTCVDDVSLPLLPTAPATLAETGLYASASAPATPDAVAAYARPFQPEYELWSDGAAKRRWAYVPKCERIGTEGMNHWLFPVGTRFWKEFTIPGTGQGAGTRVETRLLHKFAGDNDAGWLYATYQWPQNVANPTPAQAVLVTTGVVNANGTQHDIPAASACPQCHAQNLVEKVLGFGAIQLSHDLAGVTIRALADAGWLTHPRAAGGALARNGFDPPGTEQEQRALGYLHANCGNCHHMGTIFTGTTPARMRLMVGFIDTVEQTDTYTTLVNVPTVRPFFNGCDRIEPGYASHSEIIMRMNRRDTPPPGQQMPPLATEQIHMAAVSQLSSWINAMSNGGAVPSCTPPTN